MGGLDPDKQGNLRRLDPTNPSFPGTLAVMRLPKGFSGGKSLRLVGDGVWRQTPSSLPRPRLVGPHPTLLWQGEARQKEGPFLLVPETVKIAPPQRYQPGVERLIVALAIGAPGAAVIRRSGFKARWNPSEKLFPRLGNHAEQTSEKNLAQ